MERKKDVPEDLKRWLEDLRVDWRELRGEVIKVLQWQAETRPICEQHGKRLEDHEERIRGTEHKQQDTDHETRIRNLERTSSEQSGGLTVGVKVAAVLAWLTAVGIAVAGWFVK